MAYMFHVMQGKSFLRVEYMSFLHRGKLLTNKLLTWILQANCKTHRFYGRHHEIVDKFGFSVSKMILDILDEIVSSLVFLYLFCNIHVTGVSSEPGGTYSSGAPASLPYRKFKCLLNFAILNVQRIYGYGIPFWYYLFFN